MKPAFIGCQLLPADLAIIDKLHMQIGMSRTDAIQLLFQAGIDALQGQKLMDIVFLRYQLAEKQINRQMEETENGTEYAMDLDTDLEQFKPKPTELENAIAEKIGKVT
jgi:hypothetical protein